MSVTPGRVQRHVGARWATIRYALDSNARTLRLCLILLVTGLTPAAGLLTLTLLRHLLSLP